jgi:DNA-binding NtrC family response regulator
VQDELFQFLEARSRSEPHEPSVRVITGTRGNLLPEVTAGAFREDLHYRLNVILIRVPPLGDSDEDLPALLEAVKAAAKSVRHIKSIHVKNMEGVAAAPGPPQAGNGGMGRLGVANTISVIALMLRLP